MVVHQLVVGPMMVAPYLLDHVADPYDVVGPLANAYFPPGHCHNLVAELD